MSNGDIFVGEVIGTAILILFGAGVVAAVVLNHSKAKDAGWVVIAFGWGFGVMAGAYTAAPLSGGHLNPAVTLGIAVDTGEWDKVPVYVAGQMAGAMLGAVLCWLVYYAQFEANAEEDVSRPTLGIFSTTPAIRRPVANLVSETTCLGAAYAAGLATGVWNGLDELKSHWRKDAEWTPAMPSSVRDREYRNWRKAVEKSLGWVEEGED